MHFIEFKAYENFFTFEAQSIMKSIIDTHCHLYLDEFRDDLDRMIEGLRPKELANSFYLQSTVQKLIIYLKQKKDLKANVSP